MDQVWSSIEAPHLGSDATLDSRRFNSSKGLMAQPLLEQFSGLSRSARVAHPRQSFLHDLHVPWNKKEP